MAKIDIESASLQAIAAALRGGDLSAAALADWAITYPFLRDSATGRNDSAESHRASHRCRGSQTRGFCRSFGPLSLTGGDVME